MLATVQRFARITAGMMFLAFGVVLLPLPGPGTAVIVGALMWLSRDVLWARRLLDHVKRRVERVTPASMRGTPTRVAYGAFGALSAALAVAFFLTR